MNISSDVKSLPPLRNPEILIGANDLTTLSYLHEPAGKEKEQYFFSWDVQVSKIHFSTVILFHVAAKICNSKVDSTM